jgi:hypothetical protein
VDQGADSKNIAQGLLRLEAHRTLLIQMLRLAISQYDPSVHQNVLFASVLKVWRMGRAIRLLVGEGFVEEILALSRTMAEVTINAAYLQHAEDQEIDRFHHFDTQSMFKHSVRLRPHVATTLSSAEFNKIETVVENARLLTGRKDSDPSWSKRSLSKRAEYSDCITRLNLMTRLVLTAYAYGHSAIHGTFDSLDPFMSALDSPQTFSQEKRQEGLSLALSSVNFVLCTMCFYLNSFFHLDLETAIIDAGRLTVHE